MTIVLIIRFLIYLGRKKIEYNGNFDLMTFIFGKINCSHNNGKDKISDYNAFIQTFK